MQQSTYLPPDKANKNIWLKVQKDQGLVELIKNFANLSSTQKPFAFVSL